MLSAYARCTDTHGRRLSRFSKELLVLPTSMTFRSDSVTNAICFLVNGRKTDFVFSFFKCAFPHVPRMLPIMSV